MLAVAHVPSNFATYCTQDGQPVFETHFVSMDIGAGLQLFAFQSADAQQAAIAAAHKRGQVANALKHCDAFYRMRYGRQAWLYEGAPGGMPTWSPLIIAGRYKIGPLVAFDSVVVDRMYN